MKINILLNNKYYKIYNILKIINNITPLKNGVSHIEGFNDKTAAKIFLHAAKDLKAKKYDKVIIFDEDGFFPFMLLAKQEGICPAYPLDKQIASLTVQHNNANVLILAKKFIGEENLEAYLLNHLTANFEGGRHAIRTKLMLDSWTKTSKPICFNPKAKTILICSDHAGFKLKQEVISHLYEQNYQILDVGCFSNESTHYPLWAINFGLNVNTSYIGIAICSSGVGISITTNKFKGLRCCICHTPIAAEIARKKFNANVIGLGGNFVDKEIAFKTIDKFLNTKAKKTGFSNIIDKYGFKFNKAKLDIK